jgi:hypothetical protein
MSSPSNLHVTETRVEIVSIIFIRSRARARVRKTLQDRTDKHQQKVPDIRRIVATNTSV